MPNRNTPEPQPVSPPVVPLAPEDLTVAYANIALGYHKKLPELTAQIDKLEGHFLAAHSIACAALQQGRENALRLEDIALAVKAKRTFSSGQMAAVAAPPVVASPAIEFRARRSETGSEWRVSDDELEKLKMQIATKQAEERGAKEALLQKEAQELLDNSRRKERRDRILFWLAVLTPIATAGMYCLGHFTWH